MLFAVWLDAGDGTGAFVRLTDGRAMARSVGLRAPFSLFGVYAGVFLSFVSMSGILFRFLPFWLTLFGSWPPKGWPSLPGPSSKRDLLTLGRLIPASRLFHLQSCQDF